MLEAAISEVEEAIVGSCDDRADWPERISAGINAAINLLVANPATARALTAERCGESGGDAVYAAMLERFAGLLGADAPRPERLPASSATSVVSLLVAIVSCHIRAGTIDRLSDGDPDLVFLALLPYVGFAEASRWSANF